MTTFPVDRVRDVLETSGGRVLESWVVDDGGGVDQGMYLATRR
jgi:hypothetical protein